MKYPLRPVLTALASVQATILANGARAESPAIPIPVPRPEIIESKTDSPPTIAVSPAQATACHKRLSDLGVDFSVSGEVTGTGGCHIGIPVLVKGLGNGVRITPDALLDCPTAERTAEFAREHVLPAALKTFGASLTAIRHDSAYVCRARSDNGKLSEHAYGRALDISGFVLEGGREISVKLRQAGEEPVEARFQKTVREAACGPFKTVLGPGANADHEHHFHFDMAKRKSGYLYCR